jgi:hypothetical protein
MGVPWNVIGIVAGILIVLAAAGLFLTGGGGGQQAPTGPGTPAAAGAAGSAPQAQHYGVSSAGIRAEKIVYPPTVTVPKTGRYISISYPGAYTGNYTVNGVRTPIVNSADRLITLGNVSGLVTVTLQKDDRSAKQVLEAGIWKDGQLLNSANTSRPYGPVTVSAGV